MNAQAGIVSGTALRLGDFPTIVDALEFAATGEQGFNFYTPRGELAETLSYAELWRRSRLVACKLLHAGFRPGERIALVAETGPDFPICFFACLHAGIVPCLAPAETNVLARATYIERIAAMLRTCGASTLILPSRIGPEAFAGTGVRCVGPAELYVGEEYPEDFGPIQPESVAYVQFSSGSTTQPKGILITHAALMANVAAILGHGIRLNASDRAFSWLPFYHDMGLVGFLLAPLAGQCTVDYIAPSSFARRPALWLQLMSSLGSTISYAPTFGYRLATERVRDTDIQDVDLSRWRLAGIGGDMVQIDTLDQFAGRFAAAGFDRSAFVPSFGLAEATLAVSFANEGHGPRVAAPASPEDAEARSYVVCGRPLPGYDLKIVDADGRAVPDGVVGRVKVNGPSIMQGYVLHTDNDLRRDDDGYLDTGDLGFVTEGSLVITGRAKDLMLVNGRNIWPADVEWVVQKTAGIRYGQTVAFSLPEASGGRVSGAERIVVLVECRKQEQMDELRLQIADAVSRQMGVLVNVVFVPPQTITLTSSGKLRRAAMREGYVAGTLPLLESVLAS